MPVLIAAQKADIDIVRAVAARLKEAGGEVRCYLDDDDYELREMGCKIAVGLLDDAYNLAGALTNVHTFMALLPDALTWPDPLIVEQVGGAWASAAASTEIEQTILAVSQANHAFRTVEDEFKKVCDPLAIIRTRLIVGDERPLKEGSGSTVAAVTVSQLAEVLANADDREGMDGAWGLDGWPVEVGTEAGIPVDPDFVPDNAAAAKFLAGSVTQSSLRE